MQSSSMKISPFDLMSAILKRKFDPASMASDSGTAIFVENRDFLMILSIAVFFGCIFVFVWQRSSVHRSGKIVEALKPLIISMDSEPDVDDGKKKVTNFFCTQTKFA